MIKDTRLLQERQRKVMGVFVGPFFVFDFIIISNNNEMTFKVVLALVESSLF